MNFLMTSPVIPAHLHVLTCMPSPPFYLQEVSPSLALAGPAALSRSQTCSASAMNASWIASFTAVAAESLTPESLSSLLNNTFRKDPKHPLCSCPLCVRTVSLSGQKHGRWQKDRVFSPIPRNPSDAGSPVGMWLPELPSF